MIQDQLIERVRRACSADPRIVAARERMIAVRR